MTTRPCSERRTGWLRHTRRDHGRTEHRRTRSHTAFPVDRKTDRLRDRPSCTFPPHTPRCRWRGTPPHRAAPCPAERPAAPCPAERPAAPCPAVRRTHWRQGGSRRPTGECSLPVPQHCLGYRRSRRSRASLHQPSGPHRRWRRRRFRSRFCRTPMTTAGTVPADRAPPQQCEALPMIARSHDPGA